MKIVKHTPWFPRVRVFRINLEEHLFMVREFPNRIRVTANSMAIAAKTANRIIENLIAGESENEK